MFIRPLDVEIHAIQFLLTSSRMLLVKISVTEGSKPKMRLLQVRSSPQLSIDGSNMFIRPLDAEIYAIQFLLTSAKVMLIKKISPRWRTEDFSNLKDETLVLPKNKISQSTYFFRVALILYLQCLYYTSRFSFILWLGNQARYHGPCNVYNPSVAY